MSEDHIEQSTDNKNIITYTNFLTPAEQSMILTKNYKNMVLNGGGSFTERKRAFFLPSYLENVNIEDYIVALKISYSYKPLTHRDFLGTLMGLNIKSECIGDIYVFEKEAYVYVVKEMVDFIKQNVQKVGSVGVKIEEIDLKDVKTTTNTNTSKTQAQEHKTVSILQYIMYNKIFDNIIRMFFPVMLLIILLCTFSFTKFISKKEI